MLYYNRMRNNLPYEGLLQLLDTDYYVDPKCTIYPEGSIFYGPAQSCAFI